MKKRFIIYLFALGAYMIGCACQVPSPGPKIVSEEQAAKIAKEDANLLDINSIEMSTAGPIYRVVYGKDANGEERAVWISDKLVFTETLNSGVCREQAWQTARDKGFDNNTELQLIYIPENISEIVPTGGVFWWFIKSKNEPSQKSLYLNFYTGEVIRED